VSLTLNSATALGARAAAALVHMPLLATLTLLKFVDAYDSPGEAAPLIVGLSALSKLQVRVSVTL
jgi:hypothetical protein